MAGGIVDRIIDIYTRLGAPAGASISADIAAIDALLARPTADSTTNNEMRDVVGNKADAAVTTVGTDKSIAAYIKGVLNRLGAPVGASIAADIATVDTVVDGIVTTLGTPAGASVSADIATLNTLNNVPSADSTANTRLRDVAGNKSDAAVTTVAADKSLMAYTKGVLNRLGAPAGASVSADIATANTSLTTITTRIGSPAASLAADLAVVDGFMDVPAADATTNAQMRDIVGNKSDAAQTTVGTTRSLMGYTKGVLNRLGAPAGASMSADIAAVKTVVDTVSTNVSTLLTRVSADITTAITTIDAFHDVPSADATTNAQMRDVIGNKADTLSQSISANNVSLMRLTKGIIEAINPPASADDTTAAASAYVSDTIGRKDDTASTTVNTTTTMMRYIKGITAAIAHATYGLSALETRIDGIEGTTFDTSTDSLEQIRNAIAAVGGNAPTVFWDHNIPPVMNLSDATIDLNIYLTDQVGNLITTGEITPGTCRIREWTGAAWTTRVAATANSESSGIVTQAEVFNASAGYTVGNMVEIQFSTISVTVDTITTEIPTLTFYTRLFPSGSLSGGNAWGTDITGSVVADGTEQTVYQTGTTGDFADDFLFFIDVDLANMAGGDTTILRVYKEINSNFRLKQQITYVGAQTLAVFSVENEKGSNNNRIRVTLQQTGGVNRTYAYAGNVAK